MRLYRLPSRVALALVLAAAALFVALSVPVPAFGVGSVTIDPGWQQADSSNDAYWTLTATSTQSSDDFKFRFGDGGAITYWNVGTHNYWFAFPSRTFSWECFSTTYTQRLDHLNGPAYDTSRTYVGGHTPC